MKRFIGIDYGSSKCGLALGDSEIKIAMPFKVVKPAKLFLEIECLIERGEGLDAAIIGLPLNMSGEETEQTRIVKNFGAQLAEKISIQVVFEDERLSTVAAQKLGKDDASAAAYILQTYLDRQYGFSRH